MIRSLLDNDLYKFTMGQLALHQFPEVNVEYRFKCRTPVSWTRKQLFRIKAEVNRYCRLQFSDDEIEYLRSIRFFKDSYLDFLRVYRPNFNHFNAWLEDDQLQISVKGPWFLTVYFEVPVLAIVNEVYFEKEDVNKYKSQAKLYEKIYNANKVNLPFADFGTRRRFSSDWHEIVISNLKLHSTSFLGTSNVELARKYNLRPIGTHAHEMFMISQALNNVPLRQFQSYMLQAWADEYRGDLGIALTDTVGIDAFLRDFDLYFAKLYDGVRHDSGSPDEWADKVIKHYEQLGIDPRTKALVFSDGLDIPEAQRIYIKYKDRARVSFGIGTNLTNDFDEFNPLQIVMKPVRVNGKPVAKLSDSPGKGMCDDPGFEDELRRVFGVL